MLTDLEDRLSVVPRWQLVRTIQRQSVAEHSFKVELIADRVARLMFGITDEASLYRISRLARLHDLLETVMGDPPSPTKKWLDVERINDSLDTELQEALKPHMDVVKGTPYDDRWRDATVVKIADLMEASMFLYTEMCMGNKYVSKLRDEIDASMWQLLSALKWTPDQLNDILSQINPVSGYFESYVGR